MIIYDKKLNGSIIIASKGLIDELQVDDGHVLELLMKADQVLL